MNVVSRPAGSHWRACAQLFLHFTSIGVLRMTKEFEALYFRLHNEDRPLTCFAGI
jgi:hypothetical protein